jgi:multidrug efflux pump subunit AcrA (membrane-fusion protein)
MGLPRHARDGAPRRGPWLGDVLGRGEPVNAVMGQHSGQTVRKIIIWTILLTAVLGPAVVMGLWWRNHYLGLARTCTVETGDILSGVIVSGTIRSRQRAALAAEIIAAVKVIEVKEGQEVVKDQVLILMDSGVAEGEMAKARAEAEIVAQKLAELEAGPRKQEVEKARQEVSRAESNMALAQKSHESMSNAAKQGVATQTELDMAINRLRSAESELGFAKAGLDLLLAGARKEEIARARAEVDLAKGEIQRLTALLQRHTLRAPHAGIVTVKYVNVGEIVLPGQILLRMDSTKDLEVRAQVQESQLSGVAIGGKGRVLADAHPDMPLEAVVEQVLPRVDPEQGTITVLLKLLPPLRVALMDGMAADIALIGKEVKGALRVPAEAVEGRGQAASVWVRQGDSFIRRPVTAGVTDGHWVEVISGLKAGDVVRLP